MFPDVTSEALRASFAPGGDLARAFAARGEWVIHGVPRGVIGMFAAHAPGAEFGEGDRREWQDDEWGEGLVALLDAWVERVVREALALGEVT